MAKASETMRLHQREIDSAKRVRKKPEVPARRMLLALTKCLEAARELDRLRYQHPLP